MTTTQSRFRIITFINPSGEEVYRVTGSTATGRQIRQNFATIQTATVHQQELENEFHGLPMPDSRPVSTRLSKEQVAEAELAFNQLAGRPLLPAVRFYLENYREPSVKIPLAEALQRFIEAKKSSNNRPATIRSLEYKVGGFVAKHAEKFVCDITPEHLSAEIHRPGLSPVSKSNIRRALHSFFEWCATRKPQAYCAGNPVKAIEPVKVDREEPEILPLESVKRLLNAAEAHKQGVCVPYVALGLFCAIRPTELARLSWNEIDLDAKTVTIGAKLAKMRQRRIVEIPKNTIEFLRTHALARTAIKGQNWRRDFDKVKSLAGYGGRQPKKPQQGAAELKQPEVKPWTADILRHTGISHHLALHQHEGKTATWAGNSPDVIQRYYRGLVKAKDAKEFWALAPQPAKSKIIHLKAS